MMISVIIPAYNADKYLRRSIESVLAQDFAGSIQLILVDDGSTDGTAKICDGYATTDTRRQVTVIHRSNGGFSEARNSGIDAAAGEWLFFLDADDVIAPQALSTLWEVATGNGCALVAARYGRSPGRLHKPGRPVNAETKDWRRAVADVLHQRRHTDNAVWGKLYRADLFGHSREGTDAAATDALPPLRLRPGTAYEDLDVFYRLFERAGKIMYLDAALYCYTKASKSFMNTVSDKRHADLLQVALCLQAWADNKDDGMLRDAAGDRLFAAVCSVFRHGRYNPGSIDRKRLLEIVRQTRRAALTSAHARLQNRAAAAVAYFSPRLLARLLNLFPARGF